MIICNNCGNSVGDGERFCTDCGATMSIASGPAPPPIPIGSTTAPPPVPPEFRTSPPPIPTANTGGFGAAPAPAYSQPASATQPQKEPPPIPGSGAFSTSAPVTAGRSKALIAIISAVAVVAIALAVYFALESSPTAKLATALRSAVSNGKLVSLSNDDAYSYHYQLRGLDPSNKALTEVAPTVLPQLRSMGEDVFQRKLAVATEKSSDQDWSRTLRVYDWAHILEPGDAELEARWKFAEGEVAKSQSRKDDAERSFSRAAQINGSWALVQNSLGLLRSESKRWAEAIPYYQRAIEIDRRWVIPYNNLGTAYFWQKQYDSAEYCYRQAMEINANWARPHYWMARIYDQKSMKSEARNSYQTALNLDPNNYSLTSDERVFIQGRLARL